MIPARLRTRRVPHPDLDLLASLELTILETSYSIECDERWARFLSDLWSPFVGRPSADKLVAVHIVMEDYWTVRVENEVRARGADPWWVAEQLRHFFVEDSVTGAPDVLDLHAAVVVRADHVLLLAGPSKAGKTTLTLSFLERGWKHMSDDLAPIDPGTGLLSPFPKPVSVRSRAVWEHLARDWALPWPDPPQTYFLLPATVLPLSINEQIKPTRLLFPSFADGAETTVQPVSVAAAASRCAEYMRRVDPSRLRALIELCSAIPREEVRYGDSSRAAEVIDDLVAGGDPAD